MNPLCRSLLVLAAAPLLGSAAALAQSAQAPVPSGSPASEPQFLPPPPLDDSQSPSVAGTPRSSAASLPANGSAAGERTSGPAGSPPSPAAMITAGLPKYDPPKPVPAKPEDSEVDLRDVDKPQNGIIRLPRYYVRTAREAVLKAPDLVTRQGAAAIGMQRYPGLRLGPFNWLNAPIAEAMYRDDERLTKISDLTEMANAVGRGADTAESEFIKRETQDTYMRGIDWGGFIPQK